MNDFTASNGMEITHDPDRLVVERLGMSRRTVLTPPEFSALREYFIAKEDERRGRWRWPENPDYVVYPQPDEAFERMFGPGLDLVILRESDGMTKGYVRTEDQGGPPMAHRVDHMLAARAYFDAHPEPKPWHEAKSGEVWLLKARDAEEIWYVRKGHFRDIDGLGLRMPLDNAIITAGRRIWPEVSA